MRKQLGVEAFMADHWAEGGEGAADVARAVVKVCRQRQEQAQVALSRRDAAAARRSAPSRKEIYRAKDISADKSVRDQLAPVRADGLRQAPGLHRQDAVQLLDQSATCKGAPNDHTINVREVRLSAGAEFVVAICGEIMTMPGLPRVPAADAIDVGADGRIVGLF